MGDLVDAALGVVDALGHFDVGDNVEGGGCLVGAGADVGGEAAEELAEVGVLDEAVDGLVHGAEAIDAEPVGWGDFEEAFEGRWLVVDEDGAGDVVDTGGVGEVGEVAGDVAGVELFDLCGHVGEVAGGVELVAIGIEVAGEGVDGEEGEVVIELAIGGVEELFEDVAHGDDGGAAVPAVAEGVVLAHFAADGVIFFEDDDFMAGGGEVDGGAEAADAGADDEDGGLLDHSINSLFINQKFYRRYVFGNYSVLLSIRQLNNKRMLLCDKLI